MANFLTKKHLSRRKLLRGSGVALALPFLEAMVPAGTALAQVDAMPKKRAGFFLPAPRHHHEQYAIRQGR